MQHGIKLPAVAVLCSHDYKITFAKTSTWNNHISGNASLFFLRSYESFCVNHHKKTPVRVTNVGSGTVLK
jgi:hypothetical protein